MSKPKRQCLSKYEQEIEDNLDKWPQLPPEDEKRLVSELREAAREHVKRRQVTIRLIDDDLPKLKKIAAEEGLPYQTYITSMLHKIATGKIK